MLIATIDGVPVNSLSPCSEKRVRLKCDNCGATSETSYANYRRSQEHKGNTGVTTCRKCSCRSTSNKRRGKPAHNKGQKLPDTMCGENHPSWNGGRYIDSHGYVMIRVESRAKGWKGYKKEHIAIMEKHIGRSMVTGKKRGEAKEIVHHIDGNRQNNAIKNLWLTDSCGHALAHASLDKIGYALIDAGLIVFRNGRYIPTNGLIGTIKEMKNARSTRRKANRNQNR